MDVVNFLDDDDREMVESRDVDEVVCVLATATLFLGEVVEGRSKKDGQKGELGCPEETYSVLNKFHPGGIVDTWMSP